MKVLLVHNFYGSSAPSGENQVFEAEKALLVSHGHDVETFTRQSDDIRAKGVWGTVQGALATPWNPWMFREIKRVADHFRPAVVHVHNTFPLISPAIYHAIGRRAARVLTMHNYRVICPAAMLMRHGKVCVECRDAHSAWPALKHGCYRSSRAATLPLAVNIGLHRSLGTWTNEVDAFIALTDFQRKLMVSSGLPGSKVHVKPNFHPDPPAALPWEKREPYAVFVGRLSVEKGLASLLRAWKTWGNVAPELRVIGDGEIRKDLERIAAGLPVRFLGQVNKATAQAQIARARLLVLPSECLETFGLVVVEAFSSGTPAAVSNIGPLPTIVRQGGNGVVFEPSNPGSLLQVVRTAWEAPGMLERLGRGARAEFEAKYTEKANYAALMEIYQRAVEVSRKSEGRIAL